MIYRGIIAECEWCPEKQVFSKTGTIKQVDKTLLKWGWVKFENRMFCSIECKNYFIKIENELSNKI